MLPLADAALARDAALFEAAARAIEAEAGAGAGAGAPAGAESDGAGAMSEGGGGGGGGGAGARLPRRLRRALMRYSAEARRRGGEERSVFRGYTAR